ncbi:hypothetical protein, partial [Saccharothrix deserti]|uniref:hypothetical protein n=1 Tax=Saccharothrix deserti TaxID=2593674 RepID=UPI00131C6A1F
MLNLNHPRLARWEPIYTLLNEPNVEHRGKQATSETLAHPANHLPTEVKQHLVPIVEAMLTHPATVLDRFHRQPTNFGVATQLLANLDDDPTRIHDLLPSLLTGSTEQRRRATHLALRLDPATATGILIPLIGDQAPAVRADAAAVVVKSSETGCVYGAGWGCSAGWLIQATSGSAGGRGRRAKRS